MDLTLFRTLYYLLMTTFGRLRPFQRTLILLILLGDTKRLLLIHAQEGCVMESLGCANHGSEECRSKGAYSGRRSITAKGLECLQWSSHLNGYPEQGNHNFCRNPDGDASPWCYVKLDGSITFEYCFPRCESVNGIPRQFTLPPIQQQLPGAQNIFGSGNAIGTRRRPRVTARPDNNNNDNNRRRIRRPTSASIDQLPRWNQFSPPPPPRLGGEQRPEPPPRTRVPPLPPTTSTTTTTTTQQPFVEIGKSCVDEGRQCMRKGKEDCGPPGSYLGRKNRTVTGKTCQKWSVQVPHTHSFGAIHGEHNQCRVDGALGPWCPTTDPATKWEYCFPTCPDCVIDKRDCALRGQPICSQEDGYQGFKTTTVSGKTCQKWSSQSPHVHSFNNVGDHNYCRISGANAPWCFTADSNTRWEYCYRPCNVFDIQNKEQSIDEDGKRSRPVAKTGSDDDDNWLVESDSGQSLSATNNADSSISVIQQPSRSQLESEEFKDPIAHPDNDGHLLDFCDEYDSKLPFVCKILAAQNLCKSYGFEYVKSYRRAFDRRKKTKTWTNGRICIPQFSALGGCWRYSLIRCSNSQS